VFASLWPGVARTFSGDFSDYVRSILFIPFFNETVQNVRPIIGQGWTLNYEMFFYVIFGLSLMLGANQRLVVCSAVLLIPREIAHRSDFKSPSIPK
jgi:peptidoglycan/LPS O-acetylase OafA/YrhL